MFLCTPIYMLPHHYHHHQLDRQVEDNHLLVWTYHQENDVPFLHHTLIAAAAYLFNFPFQSSNNLLRERLFSESQQCFLSLSVFFSLITQSPARFYKCGTCVSNSTGKEEFTPEYIVGKGGFCVRFIRHQIEFIYVHEKLSHCGEYLLCEN